LAFSKPVAVEVIDRPAGMVVSPPVIALSFKGPGWLFFTTKLGSERRYLRKVASFNIFLAVVLLGLVLLLFLPLF
jgi:TM2 domain-containing membrane protein YozV